MKIPSDIKALLDEAKRQRDEIKNLHDRAVTEGLIPERLGPLAKNQLENLRSALDYIAGVVRDACCPNAKGDWYFPLTTTRTKFQAKIQREFPGLEQNCPDVWKIMERCQPYPQRGPRLRSLRQLHRLSNIKKHRHLVPLSRREAPVGDPQGNKLGPAVYRLQDPSRPEPDVWVDFVFKGTNISAVWLPEGALGEVRWIVDKIRFALPD